MGRAEMEGVEWRTVPGQKERIQVSDELLFWNDASEDIEASLTVMETTVAPEIIAPLPLYFRVSRR